MNVKKSLLFLLIVPLLFFVYSCGGGSGSGYNPPGTGSGEVSKVELSPARYTAHTNGCLNMYARVIDGDGAYLSNVPVTFVNLSSIGQILNKCGGGQVTSATTDSNGLAKVALYSTTPGFSTIQAEVYKGAGQIRDRKTVYFSTHDLTLLPSLSLEVESVPSNETSGPTIYNDIHDITLFENDGDDVVEVIATVRDIYGIPIAYEPVSWYSSHSEAGFSYAEAMTNSKGKAKAIVHVKPSSIRETETSVNIMAYAYNGAANITTLFLKPVVISKSASSLTAYPNVVNVNGTSAVTAVIKLNTGAPAPSGISVNFTTTCGSIDPFALISSNGVATATFKAPPTEGSCAVRAIVGGETLGPVNITVTTSLTVQPGKQIVNGVSGGKATFNIFGGYPGYTVISDNRAYACNSSDNDCSDSGDTGKWTVSSSGGTFTVTVPAGTPAKTVTLTVRDSSGTTKDATLEIEIPTGEGTVLSVKPNEITVNGAAPEEEIPFIITGGTPDYMIFSNNPLYTPMPATVDESGGKFTVTIPEGSAAGTVTLTVLDSVGNIATAKIIITTGAVEEMELTVFPATQTISNPDTDDEAEYIVIGGTGPYRAYADRPDLVTLPTGTFSGPELTVEVDGVPSVDTTVKITVYDSLGASKEVSLVLDVTPTLPLTVTPSSITLTGFTNPESYTSDNVKFYVSGGAGDDHYSMFSSNDAIIPSKGAFSGHIFEIDPQAVATNTTVTLTVMDTNGAIKTVTVTVTPATSVMTLNPSSIDVSKGDSIRFYILGGTPNYKTYSTNPTCAPVPTYAFADTNFDIDILNSSVCEGASVTITVEDSLGNTATATINIATAVVPLSVNPPSATVKAIDNPPAGNANSGCPPDVNTIDDLTITISGGTSPYFATSNDLTVIPACAMTLVGGTLTVDPDSVAANTPVIITITDSSTPVQTKTVIVTVTP